MVWTKCASGTALSSLQEEGLPECNRIFWFDKVRLPHLLAIASHRDTFSRDKGKSAWLSSHILALVTLYAFPLACHPGLSLILHWTGTYTNIQRLIAKPAVRLF